MEPNTSDFSSIVGMLPLSSRAKDMQSACKIMKACIEDAMKKQKSDQEKLRVIEETAQIFGLSLPEEDP